MRQIHKNVKHKINITAKLLKTKKFQNITFNSYCKVKVKWKSIYYKFTITWNNPFHLTPNYFPLNTFERFVHFCMFSVHDQEVHTPISLWGITSYNTYVPRFLSLVSHFCLNELENFSIWKFVDYEATISTLWTILMLLGWLIKMRPFILLDELIIIAYSIEQTWTHEVRYPEPAREYPVPECVKSGTIKRQSPTD